MQAEIIVVKRPIQGHNNTMRQGWELNLDYCMRDWPEYQRLVYAIKKKH